MSFTEADVQNALKNLTDPNTKKDFVSSKSVKNIKINGSDVSLDILLGYPAKSVWDEIRTTGRSASEIRIAGKRQGQRQRQQQSRAACSAARRETGRRREEHHCRGERQGRRRQKHHRGESGAGIGCRRRPCRHPGCRHLRTFATHHAGHHGATGFQGRQDDGTRWRAMACKRCPSAS